MNKSIKELIDRLNNLKIHQRSIDWMEDLPDDIYQEVFKGKYTEVVDDLDVDTHRWYETSISVIGILDSYLGVRRVSNTFSESMCVDDVYHHLEFFEMKEVKTITYKQK